MGLRNLVALLLLGVTASTASALAGPSSPLFPCRKSEPVPGSRESNPTVRDPLVTVVNGTAGKRDVSSFACIVLGTSQPAHPGGSFQIPSAGLYYSWNLALVGSGGWLVDAFGTQTWTGPVGNAGKLPFSTPISLGAHLGADQPAPLTDRLFAQVAAAPCVDTANPCKYDSSRMFWVTRLLGSSNADAGSSFTMSPPAGQPACLAPVKPGLEFELHQLTVVAYKDAYHIFACVVSDRFASFKVASFNVNLLAADGTPVATVKGGNTRSNIGPLFSRGSGMPHTVALLAVDITAITSNGSVPKPVASAETEVQLIGCANPDETACRPLIDQKWPNHPVVFEHAGAP